MTYAVLKLAHIIGAIPIGATLIGVWLGDMRTRESRQLARLAEAVRNIAVFYDGVVVPGALDEVMSPNPAFHESVHKRRGACLCPAPERKRWASHP